MDREGHSRHHTGSTTEEDESPGPAPAKKRAAPVDSETEVQAAPPTYVLLYLLTSFILIHLISNRFGNHLGRIAGRTIAMFSRFPEILNAGVMFKGSKYVPHNHTSQSVIIPRFSLYTLTACQAKRKLLSLSRAGEIMSPAT